MKTSQVDKGGASSRTISRRYYGILGTNVILRLQGALLIAQQCPPTNTQGEPLMSSSYSQQAHAHGVAVAVPSSIVVRLPAKTANSTIEQIGRHILTYLAAPPQQRVSAAKMAWVLGAYYHVPVIGVYLFYWRIVAALFAQLQRQAKTTTKQQHSPAKFSAPTFPPEPPPPGFVVIDADWREGAAL